LGKLQVFYHVPVNVIKFTEYTRNINELTISTALLFN
jgi:hypothetical protein